jgi:structural maintenance of chromosome 1
MGHLYLEDFAELHQTSNHTRATMFCFSEMLISLQSSGLMALASQMREYSQISIARFRLTRSSMDAISFVLGIKSSHLRSTHLRELVYRGRVLRHSTVNGDGAAEDGVNGHTSGDGGADVDGSHDGPAERSDPKSAWVMAVYEDDAGDEQQWKRAITNQGVSEYRINNRVVTAAQYNDALEAENILIKARNFLVFQGDVEAIASQSPKDLTRLIEQISGSLEYKADYERLKAEHEDAGEQQTFQLNRRRGMNSEIKQYQDQKREAENYARKANERDQAIVTHVLWKLYHFQRQIEESSAEIQRHQNELKEFRRGIAKFERQLEVAKNDHIKVTKDVSKVERTIKQKEKEIEAKSNSLVPVNEKIEISTKKLSKYTSRIADISKEKDAQTATVKSLEKDLKTVEKAQGQWEKEWKAASSKTGSQLSDADLQQYNKLKEEVNKRSSTDQIRVDNLKRQRAADEGTVINLKSTVDNIEWQLRSLETDMHNFEDRKGATNEIVQQVAQEIDEKKRAVNAMTSERLRITQMRTELEEKLQDVLKKLIDADDGRKQNEKEVRMKETISTLKRIFPGVKGRVSELCKPKQKKYAEAVSTVLGRHFDAIVVDNEKTAKDCIQHLRDTRSGQATFIPLDTIQVKALSSSLKGMHRNMRPAIETVDYDQSVSRAISYACGNSIVCDDLDTAKYLCYERGVDAKAVTLDGTVIHKGGLMTGGRGPGHQQARRWEDAEVENLNKLKDKLMKDLAALPSPHRRGNEEELLTGELSGLESRHRFAREELQGLERNLQSKKKEVDNAKRQLKEAQPKYREKQKALDDLDENISEYQEAVSRVEDDVFADFCQRLGFEDIREYEAQQGSLQQEAAQKNLEFTTQKSRIENQLSFERQRLQATDARIQSLQGQDERDRALIEELNEQREQIQNALDVLNAELDQLGDQLDDQKDLQTKAAEKLADRRQQVQKRSQTVEATLKIVNGQESDIQRHSSSRYTLLRRCKLEDINIPLAEGSTTFDQLPIDDLLPATDPDSMEVDEDEDPTSSALQPPQIQDHGIEPDFSILDDDLKEQSSPEIESDLLSHIHTLESDLDKMAPNMRAVERLETVETKLRSTEKDFDDARRRYRESKQAFEEVMHRRSDLFNKAFTHISEQIGPIYKDLTKSTNYPLGGQAYLDIGDTDEPYLDGIKYHAMPPLKRFRDMEHLSGGEKTMAALALLFAVHSYQPSPFFVLDEVDAALDNANVGKIANYIREHAQPGMQFIVISLKTGLFQNSETLVGIYRDQGGNSSRSLTLDVSNPFIIHFLFCLLFQRMSCGVNLGGLLTFGVL